MNHMVEDLNDQLREKIKGKAFGLQLDKATNTNMDLICYEWLINSNDMEEDILFLSKYYSKCQNSEFIQDS